MRFIWVLLLIISLLGCKRESNKKNIDDFSTGLANRDERIQEGIKYIENQNIKSAKEFFEKLGKENPNHCGYLIGKPLVGIQDYLAKISSIINIAANLYSSTPHFHVKETSEYCDGSIDQSVRDFISDLHGVTSEGTELIVRAINQKCEMDLKYPIMLSVGPNFVTSLYLYGRIGEVELSFLKYLGNFVLIISDIILAHDFSINTPAIIPNINKIDTSEIIGLIRTLAFLFQTCRSTLSFHPEWKEFLNEIPKRITEILSGAFDFLKYLESRNKKEGYMITFEDNSGDMKFGYDPNKTTIDTPQDQITIHVGGSIKVGDIRANLKELKIKIPYIITFEFLDNFHTLVNRLLDIISNRKKGCPENCISVSDLNFFMRAFGTYLEDFLRIDIMNFMENPKPLRDIIPYWFYNTEKQRWEFFIEAEVPESRKDLKYYLFNYDSGHFQYPSYTTFYENVLSNYSIPPDCISVSQANVSWILIPYMLFQDPGFSNSVYMRLKGVFIERCSSSELVYDTDVWRSPDVYMINKGIAMVVQKTGSIISPLTELILKSVEIQ